MSPDDIIAALQERFGDRIQEAVTEEVKDPFVRVDRADLVEVMRFLRDDERLGFDMLACLSAVDYPKDERIQLVYHLDSVRLNHAFTLKVDLPRDDAVCPSLEGVWRTADWHEREAWDLMGVRFTGHPNLVRILCAEDWEGHPLRKDYEMPRTYHGIPNDYEMFYDVENP